MHEKCRFLGLFRPFEAVIHRLQRALSVSSPALIPTFSTAVNTWQCDENNHLNVQFYTEFGHEASAHLLAHWASARAPSAPPGSRRRRRRRPRPLPARVPRGRSGRGSARPRSRSASAISSPITRCAIPPTDEVAATIRRRIACDRAVARRVPRARRGSLRGAARQRPGRAASASSPCPTCMLGEARVGRPDRSRPHADHARRMRRARRVPAAPPVRPLLRWRAAAVEPSRLRPRRDAGTPGRLGRGRDAEPLSPPAARRRSRRGDERPRRPSPTRCITFTHFLFEAETGTLAACAEAVGMKFDQKIRKIMTFPPGGSARLHAKRAGSSSEEEAMDEKTKTAAGIAARPAGHELRREAAGRDWRPRSRS